GRRAARRRPRRRRPRPPRWPGVSSCEPHPSKYGPRVPPAPPRVLILSASIGDGHDRPALLLADALRARRPNADVAVADGLQAMRYWAHSGADVYLVIHPESIEEVREIAGPRASVVPVRGLSDPRFLAPAPRPDARAALDLPAAAEVVAVSGGGWGVGDLE